MKQAFHIFGIVLAAAYGVSFVGMLALTLCGMITVEQGGEAFAWIVSNSPIGAISMLTGAAIACVTAE